MPGNDLPLSRFRVLDLTRARSGPTATRQLGDWGADVVKIETPPALGNVDAIPSVRHGFDFQNLHRNKRSMTLNLKSDEGRSIFLRLAEGADVVVENFRPAVKHRLGVDYEAVRKVNPGIVYGSISGFGQTGPYADRPGLDQIAQGMSGLMSITGLPGQGPVRVGTAIVDTSAGMLLAQGILVALLEREVSGQGQWVHTSLLEAAIQVLDFQAARYLKDGQVPGQAGNSHPTEIPASVFPTADGYINIQAGNQHIFERLSRAIGAPDLPKDPAYASKELRSRNRDRLHGAIGERTRMRKSLDWVEILNEAGVPCGPIYDVGQAFNDPHVKQLGLDPAVTHPTLGTFRVVGQATKLARTPHRMRFACLEIGEHTAEVLAGIGYDAAAVAALRERGVV
ncbi:MAG: CoA transferase [Proteobacteria bacterium]|nr:CoA transferase [Pseudomonadota bacterium]